MKKSLFSLVMLLMGQALIGQNCLSGWRYYQPLTIQNPGNAPLLDVQVRFELNTGALVSAGKLQASAADLRITDAACNLLPFYVDSAATSTTNGIWVRVPAIPANDSVILQVYYGNAGAGAYANGDSTFIFFDDFSASAVDTNKWEAIGGYTQFATVNGALNYSSNGTNPGPRFKFARTKMQFSETVDFDFSAQVSNGNGFGFSSGDSTIQRILFRQSGAFGFDTLNQVALILDTISNGFQVNGFYPFIRFPRDTYTDASIRAGIENDKLTLTRFINYSNNSSTDSTFRLNEINMGSFHFIVSAFLTQTIYLDYLRVRKPVPSTVSASLGLETELDPNSIADLSSGNLISLSPNPASSQLRIAGLPEGRFTMQLMNAQGQTLYDAALISQAKQSLQIELPHLASGIYWVAIREGGRMVFTQSVAIHAD